jgi:hypothetical protein
MYGSSGVQWCTVVYSAEAITLQYSAVSTVDAPNVEGEYWRLTSLDDRW